jgi:hypothetical protein
LVADANSSCASSFIDNYQRETCVDNFTELGEEFTINKQNCIAQMYELLSRKQKLICFCDI